MATQSSGVLQEPGYERKEERGPAAYEEEEDLGVPAGSARGEKYPTTGDDWWNTWNFGLTYNDQEYSDGLFWRAVLAEGSATTAFTFFVLSTWLSLQEKALTDIGVLRIALTAGLTFAVLHWAFFSGLRRSVHVHVSYSVPVVCRLCPFVDVITTAPASRGRSASSFHLFGSRIVCGMVIGHMNPAVTLALMLNGRVTIFRALCYWAAQIVGGIVGAYMARAMSPGAFRAVQGGVNRLNVSWGAALLGEIMGTLLVIWAFLVAYDRYRRMTASHVHVMAPLFIGLAVTAAHLFLVPFTWCSINPARSFGAAVAAHRWRDHWLWWVAPIIAAVAGPLIYESFFKYFKSGTQGSVLEKPRDPYAPSGQAQTGVQPTTYP